MESITDTGWLWDTQERRELLPRVLSTSNAIDTPPAQTRHTQSDGDEHPAARSGVHIASFFAGDTKRADTDLKYQLASLLGIACVRIPKSGCAITGTLLRIVDDRFLAASLASADGVQLQSHSRTAWLVHLACYTFCRAISWRAYPSEKATPSTPQYISSKLADRIEV
jgi:hypothetical protein